MNMNRVLNGGVGRYLLNIYMTRASRCVGSILYHSNVTTAYYNIEAQSLLQIKLLLKNYSLLNQTSLLVW